MTAPDFENSLKKQELQNNLFTYIGGGIRSPFFVTNNAFKEQTKKLDIAFINLSNVYKKKESFSNNEIQTYINNNKDNLKNEYVDLSYLKLTPQNLVETDEYNELFFEKIDQIENKILNEVKFKDIIAELKIQPIIKKNYIGNSDDNKIEKKIYQKRNEEKIQLIDENEFYVLYEISKINKILPNLDNENFRNKIKEILYQKSKYFIDGLDIGDFTILASIAKESNIQENDFKDFINDKNIKLVASKISIAREKNISGVPFYEIGRDFISGAQSPIQLEEAIKANL